MKFKKLLALGLVTIISVSSLVGCSSNSSTEENTKGEIENA